MGFEVSPLFVWRCLAEYKTATEAMVTRSAAKGSAMDHVEASTAGDDSDEHVRHKTSCLLYSIIFSAAGNKEHLWC